MADIPVINHVINLGPKRKNCAKVLFTIQPEVLISFQNSDISGQGELDLTYIDVPLLAKLAFNSGFFVEIGPYIGFLINASQTGYNTNAYTKANNSSTDVGACFGGGYFIKSLHLGIDARLNIGDAHPYVGDYINN